MKKGEKTQMERTGEIGRVIMLGGSLMRLERIHGQPSSKVHGDGS